MTVFPTLDSNGLPGWVRADLRAMPDWQKTDFRCRRPMVGKVCSAGRVGGHPTTVALAVVAVLLAVVWWRL